MEWPLPGSGGDILGEPPAEPDPEPDPAPPPGEFAEKPYPSSLPCVPCSPCARICFSRFAYPFASPRSAGFGGVPLTTTGTGPFFTSSPSFSSPPPAPDPDPADPEPFAFFSSATFRPITPRYQNMRLLIKTCSYSGRRALASLMCDNRYTARSTWMGYRAKGEKTAPGVAGDI